MKALWTAALLTFALVGTGFSGTTAVAADATTTSVPTAAATTTPKVDYDGDGYGDLAIGDPDGVFGRTGPGVRRAGAVRVIYGSRDGLGTRRNQYWTQDTLGFGAEVADNFGASLASGDFNGDGYTDLAVGVPRERVGRVARAGAVNVIYGSRDGLTARGAQFLSQRTPGLNGGPEAWDHFGMTLAAANFGRGRQDDLAIGIPYEDLGSATDANPKNAGAVQVLYGSTRGLSTQGDQLWSRDSAGLGSPHGREERFGLSLAAGDLGRSGYADLAVGVPRLKVGERTTAGGVYVLYGSAAGLTGRGAQLWTQDTPGVANVAGNDNLFGTALAIGNVGRDSRSDLVVGAPQEWVDGERHVGAVNVIYGSADGLQVTGNQYWTPVSLGLDVGAQARRFGAVLALGDFGRDGYADLATPYALVYGGDDGPRGKGNRALPPSFTGDVLLSNDFGRGGRTDLAVGRGAGSGSTSAEGFLKVAYQGADGPDLGAPQVFDENTSGLAGQDFVLGRTLGPTYCRGYLCPNEGNVSDFGFYLD